MLGVVPRLPRPEGEGGPGSLVPWLPAMFGPQAEVWVGREGKKDLRCGAYIPSLSPQAGRASWDSKLPGPIQTCS